MFELTRTVLHCFTQQLALLIEQAERRLASASGETGAYQVASASLELLGVHPLAAYQALPGLHARTVRRLTRELEQPIRLPGAAVHISMSVNRDIYNRHTDSTGQQSLPQPPPQLGVDPAPDLAEVTHWASQAGVNLKVAVSSVLKYLNPQLRVAQVLADLHVVGKHQKLSNPTGLFVKLMRTGEDVTLPPGVKRVVIGVINEDKPELCSVDTPAQGRSALKVGDKVKWYGQVCEVMEVGANMSLLRTPDGLDTSGNTDRLLTYRLSAG